MAYNDENQSTVFDTVPDTTGALDTRKLIQEQAYNSVAIPKAPTWGSGDISQDPAYNAFLRGAKLSESQIRAQTERQQGAINAQLEAQRPMWAQSLQQGLRGAAANAAQRGTSRSSNRIENQNLVQQGVDRQRAGAEASAAGQIGNLAINQAEALARLQQQQAEAALQAQQNIYNTNLQDYESQLMNAYLQQLAAGGAING